jgi:hypothetical protein
MSHVMNCMLVSLRATVRPTLGMSGVAERVVAAQRFPKPPHSHLGFIVARRERPRPLHSEVIRGAPLIFVNRDVLDARRPEIRI